MSAIRRFLGATPFLKYLAAAVFVGMLALKVGVWAKHRVETYAYEVLIPRVMEKAQAAVADGIRKGANGAISDATGGLLGNVGPLPALTAKPGAATNGTDPCRTLDPFGAFPRLIQGAPR